MRGEGGSDQIGNDVVTASGTTLLGADNKAGVAEIMAAAEYLVSHPEIRHGRIRIGFTPDEEVGAGTKYFDVARFRCAGGWVSRYQYGFCCGCARESDHPLARPILL